MKKTLELEQHMLRTDKDLLQKTQKDYELKLKEIEILRTKLQKDNIESIENFKSEYQRKFQDQDFEYHRRKLQIEEDEQRVKLEKDRITAIETRNIKLSKDFQEIEEEVKKLRKENTQLFKDNHEQKE